MDDVFAIQDEITLAIVDKLKVKLLGADKVKLARRQTVDLKAYDLYLRGRYFWNKRTKEGLGKAIQCFKDAISKDPQYAPAYAGLADSYVILPYRSFLPPREAFPVAKEMVLKALELDNTLAEAHASLAWVNTVYDWNWKDGEKEFKRAIELNPGYVTAHYWYALHLAWMGRFDEAVEEIKRALELDPLSLIINVFAGLVFNYADLYDQATEVLQKTIEMDPNFALAHGYLGRAYLRRSMYEEALQEFKKEMDIAEGTSIFTEADIGFTYALMGKRDETRRLLEEFLDESRKTYIPSMGIAKLYFALGENDTGFEWLERAYVEHEPWLCFLKIDPLYDSVRDDPRYLTLLKKIGLDK
jgi:tetratricopeptide (TPR) repeat protein